MNSFIKRALIIISVFLNLVLVSFIVFAVTRKTSSMSFKNLDNGMTAACFVSVPSSNAGLTLGTPQFSLKPGEEASFQFSLFIDRRQVNLALDPLYDHDIISAELTGFGLAIKALKPGETVLQTLTGKGINNIAVITVAP
jgi:hypothetical protein